ncbi:MAG: amidohydrolase family protein [Planctomycetes bacterium]|nr:amidohydrolase family protein [Planctomycetota bacterium]
MLALFTLCFAALSFEALSLEAQGAAVPKLAEDPRSAASTDTRPILIQAGAVIDAKGQRFAPGSVLVKDGKILAVGSGLVAENAELREFGARAVVTPGLIEANAELEPLERAEEGVEITPRLRLADGLDPESRAWAGLRRNGVTSAFLSPSGRSVISGRGAVVKTMPTADDRWILDAAGALKATTGQEPSGGNIVPRFGRPNSIFYRRPTTRMGVTWEFRKAFSDAQLYAAARQAGGPLDPDAQVLADLMASKGEIRMRARLLQDIRTAIRLAEEFGLRLVIEEGIESFRSPEEILAAKAKLIYGPTLFQPAGIVFGFGFGGGSVRQQETDRNYLATPARLHAAGVEFALGSAEYAASDRGLAHQAAIAVHFGLPREVALRACTVVPATWLGIDKRVGTLEVGKDADLVVWSGEPFELATRPVAVMVDGAFADAQED